MPEYSAGFEINTRNLFASTQNLGSGYKPLSRYPGTERDICFRVDNDMAYARIKSALENSLKDVEMEAIISPVDIYQPDDGTTKNVTIRVKLTAIDHTLTSDEVAGVIEKISQSVISETDAVVI